MCSSVVKLRSFVALLLLAAALPLSLLSVVERAAPSEDGLMSDFWQLQQKCGPRWLGGSHGAKNRGVTLALQWTGDSGAVTLRSAPSSYLVCSGGRAFFVIRAAVTASELWRPRVLRGDALVLESRANGRYLRLRGGALSCDTDSVKDATRWKLRAPKQRACLSASVLAENQTSAVACWSAIERERGAYPMILFGTLKPLRRAAPSNASDMFDPFIIAKRTLINWARLPRVQPVVLTDDALSQNVIHSVNVEHAGQHGFTPIDIIGEFELQQDYRLPTYRGLFRAVIGRYPLAEAIMYSNMDILYTSSLARTVDAVRSVYEGERPKNPSRRGWFVVGRRINVNVPADWSMEGRVWEPRMEHGLKPSGDMFGPDAEDYFIVHPKLFNWGELPPFIVGGIVFDNWLTSQAVRLHLAGQALAVDATRTLTAIHQNHGKDVFASALKPKSAFNLALMKANGGMPHRLTTSCPRYTREESLWRSMVVARRKVPRPEKVLPNYATTMANAATGASPK
ncbi:glycosyl transferase family 2 [Trypanosoma conorhini]|uniref:Glycosyl transferase family 2 n=1 Tax=Trypanosoma conorhini TaxID=83891 RepID=A0A422QBY7_9TRYP|nr:glycosyl transferase family 2 [Trypanosoma conorhini]RNF27477.1 glycosyl transferase family 2 [Trypanosoma conorhini]